MSFPGWTTVLTTLGPLPIEEIVQKKLPIQVLSCKPGRTLWAKIQRALVYDTKPLMRIILSNGTCLELSPDQPLYVSTKGYLQARSLTEKDALLALKGLSHFTHATPISIHTVPTPYKTYELIIEHHHTYFPKNILVRDTVL